MAGAMDERVVSMEFDNRQFERNVKTSMKTIDDLKESLDFSKSGETLDEMDSKFKKIGKENVFKDLDESCSSLKKGMGLLGDSATSLIGKFAEMTKIVAIFELAEKAVRSLESAIKQFTIQPISEGFGKYTTKIGAIKTIANATKLGAEQVNEELERLNWFTDETSASFGNMVENIGKFTSVGRGLDESITAMQGIATWGYQSGAGVQEINRAMYNLSQALGTGSVKLMDWKSIENAGMATEEFKKQAIAAAEAAGKLKRKGDKLFTADGKQEVTTANFNATLQKGWFTSDVLMQVLETYGGFATELRKYMEDNPEIERATDAMIAMDKDRLKKRAEVLKKNYSILGKKAGMTADEVDKEIERIADIDKLEEREEAVAEFAKKFGIDMSEVNRINEISSKTEKQKELKKWADKLGISVAEATTLLDELMATEESLGEKAFKSSQQSKSLTDAIEATKDAVSTGWMNTFQHIFGGLDDSIALWTDVTDILWDLFAAGADARNNAFMHWAEDFAGRDDLWGEDGIMHSIMDTIIELKNLLGSSFKNVFFKDLEKVLGMNYDDEEAEGVKVGNLTDAQIRYRREGRYFGDKLKSITTALKNFGITIRDFVNKNLDKFGTIFESVATVVKFFGSIIGSIFTTIGNFLKNSGIVQDILNLATRVAEKVRSIVERIQASGFVTKVIENIGNALTWLYQTVKKWIDQIGEFFEETGIGQAIRDFFNGILEFFIGGENDVDEEGKKTESGFFRAFGWLGDVKAWIDGINLKDVLYTVKSFFDNFGTLWSAFTGGLNGEEVDSDKLVSNGLPAELKGTADTFAEVGKKLSGVVNFFKDIWTKFTGWLESSGILPTLRSWWDGIKTFFSNIGLVWEAFTTGKVADPSKLDKKQKDLVNGVINFAKKLSNAWNKVKGWFTSAWEWIKEKWGAFTEWLETSGILPKIREIWKNIKEIFGNIGLVWRTFTQGLGGTKVTKDQFKQGGISDSLAGILETVSNIGASIKEAWDNVTGWLESSGILPTLRSWWDGIKNFFEEVWKGVGDGSIFQKVGDFFTNLWSTVTGWFGGGEQVEIPETTVDPTSGKKGVKKKTNGTGIGGGFFQSIAEAFTNDQGQFDLIKGLSTGIAKLFEAIGSIDWTQISSTVFGVLVDVINGLDDACGKLHIDNILAIIGKIMSVFTGAMIVKSISDITSTIRTIVKKGKDKTLLEKFTDLLSAIGTALLQIGISFALIAASLWLLSTIKTGDLVKAMVVFGIIAVLFGVLLAFAAKGAKNKNLSKTLAAMGSAFLQIGVAVALITLSIAALVLLMSIASAGKIIAAIALVAAIMVGMMLIIKWMSKVTEGNMVRISAGIAVFAGMAILLATITVCLLLLQGVNFGKALIDLGLLVLALAAMVVAMKFMDKVKISAKAVAMMIVLAGIIAIMTAAFLLLKDMDQGQMAVITGLFVGVLAALVIAILALQHVNPAGAVKAALAIGLFITAIAAALSIGIMMVSASAQSLIDTLVDIMSSMGAASNSASTINKEAILDAIKLLGDIVVEFAKTTTCDTTTALKVASDTWTFLNRFKLASQSAEMIAVDKFEAIFGKDGSGGLLTAICTGLAGVTETGETALTLSSNLKTFGENLQAFGESASAFSNKDTGYASGVTALFGKDGKNGLFGAMKTAVTGITDTGWNARVLLWNLVDMGNHLEMLALSGSKLGGDSATNITNVKDRLEDLVTIVNLASSLTKVGDDGVTEFDPTTIAVGIANIGAALELYNKAISVYKEQVAQEQGVDLGAGESVAPISVDNIKTALDMIVSALPNVAPDSEQMQTIEGWAKMATGDNGQTLFSLGLINMANAIAEFSNQAKNFDEAKSQQAINALSQLASIYTATGNGNPSQYDSTIEGVAGWEGKMGDNNAFASAIIGMGNALSSFSTSAESYNATKGALAIGALSMLASIYKITGMDNPSTYTPMIEGVADWGDLGDVNNKNSFTGAIIGMGNAMSSFGKSVKNIPQEAVTNATTALQTLAAIYNELSGNEDMIKYFSESNDEGLKKLAKELGKNTISEVFTDFGEGIGKIGDAMSAFGKAVSAEENKYDPEKVSAATSIVQDLGKLEIALRQSGLDKKWWNTDENLKTMGNNLSGLGSRLTQFSKELAEFDLDTDSKKWIDIKAVLNFLTEVSTDLGQISDVTNETKWVGGASNYDRRTANVQKVAYTLGDMATDIGTLTTNLKKFSDSMKTDNLGDWSSDRWENIKAVLTTFKDISLAFKTNGLEKGNFYDLDNFGYSIQRMIEHFNWGNVLENFMNKFAAPDKFESTTTNFIKFIEAMKLLADATVSFHGMGVNKTDVENVSSLMDAILKFNFSGITSETFNADGIKLASEFMSGLAKGMSIGESGEGDSSAAWQSLKTSMASLLAIIEGYDEDFYEAGKTAGSRYAAGFNEGLDNVNSDKLTPVIEMDADNNVTGGSGIVGILTKMNYATTTDISGLATRLDNIQRNFDNPIKVNDSHNDIVDAIGKTNDKLKDINTEVSNLKTKVENLKVYMDTNRLVGAIAPAMNRKLGNMANMSP